MSYAVREVCEGRDLGEGAKGLIVSEAAETDTGHGGRATKSRPISRRPTCGLRGRRPGRSVADIFAEHGIALTKTSNDRLDGWMAMHERLHVFEDERGQRVAKLRIFPLCTNLIRTLPQLRYDDKRD